MVDMAALDRWMQERDADAFREITSKHAAMVYAACLRILRSTEEAEDAALECFEILAEMRVRPPEHLPAWLHGVAVDRALERLKRGQMRHGREVRPGEGTGKSRETDWALIRDHIDEAMCSLPRGLHAPVAAHFLADETQGEIAQALGQTRTTVAAGIERGMRGIRKSLQARGITVSADLLAILMNENLSEAVLLPASLTAALEKVAQSGPEGPRLTRARTAAEAYSVVEAPVRRRAVMAVTILAAIILAAWVGARVMRQKPEQPEQTTVSVGSPVDEGTDETPVDSQPSPPRIPQKADSSKTERPPRPTIVKRQPDGAPMPGDVALEGMIVDGDTGEVVANAQVFLARIIPVPPPADAAKAVSDEKGTYRIAKLDQRDKRVWAYHPEYAPAFANISPANGQRNDVRITLRKGGAVSGVVTWGGQPLAGCEVVADYAPVGLMGKARTMTGQDGAYRIEHLPAGKPIISVMAEKTGDELSRMAEIENGMETDVDFDFQQGSGFGGTVFMDGEALAGARIDVVVIGADGATQKFTTTTASDGTYGFDSLPEGTVTLKVSTRGSDEGPAFLRAFDMLSGQDNQHDIQISDERGDLTCQVFLAEGERTHGVGVYWGEIPVYELNMHSLEELDWLRVAKPRLSADGVFAVEGLEAGVYTILAVSSTSNGERAREESLLANMRYGTAVVEVVSGQETVAELSLE